MPLFQNSVIVKYLNTQNKKIILEKWNAYKNHFLNPTIQENIRNSKEEQYQGEFLIDLFVNILGYIKNPTPNFNLTTELKNEKDSKKADGGILIPMGLNPLEKIVIGVIELKGTNTTDLNKIEVQAFGYKNNQKDCVYVITSNFEKLRFYIDNAIEHIEFNLFKLTQKDFELLYLCLAYNNISTHIPKKLKDESVSQEDKITKELYKDYSLFKKNLFHSLTTLNKDFEPLELFKKSQKLLDRFLFLFFAEDRQLLPPNSVRLILDDWKDLKERDVEIPLYDRYKKYFEYLNTGYKGKRYDVFAYNGGLFKPDEILDNIKIDDELLYKHTLKLSGYDFVSEVDVNILGHIFENSLNELDEMKAQLYPPRGLNPLDNPLDNPLGEQTLGKQISKRKKDGVFYTPKYITKYIVENTVGKLCTDKKLELEITEADYFNNGFKSIAKKTKQPLLDKLTQYRKWLMQITIIDPACGSGAFLNEALNFLISEHTYIDELQAKLFGDTIVLSDVQKSILENNLFGVDLNEESVEIAKLSLWLRTAQPNRKLNDLNNNIKCGNSLIDDETIAGDKAFNWQKEFPQIFETKKLEAFHLVFTTHNSRTSQRMIDLKIKKGEPTELNLEQEISLTEIFKKIIKDNNFKVLAYNICKDHVHIIVVCEFEEVHTVAQKLKGASSRLYSSKGFKPLGESLWSQKFFFANLDVMKLSEISNQVGYSFKDKYIDTATRYIENNRNKHNLPYSKELEKLISEFVLTQEQAFVDEYKGGFDVVIGNPPYVLCQPSNTNENTLNYYKKFEVASYKIDLFHLFFEKGIQILKEKGKLGFITPNTYLTNKYIQKLRNYILQNTFINEVINYNDVVFIDAGVDVATILLTKENKQNDTIDIFSFQKGDIKLITQKSQKEWNEDSEQIFNLKTNFIFKFKDCLKLEEIGNTYFGIQAFDRKISISYEQINDNYLPIIDGSEVIRFQNSMPNKYFNFISENIKSGGDWNIYLKDRIVISQIGQVPKVGLCDSKILTSNTIYNLYIVDSNYTLKYLFTILNSKLIKQYWMSKYNDNKDLFPKIKGFQLKQLPIKKISLQAQQPFIEKAEQMLSLSKEFQLLGHKFQRNIQREFFSNPRGLNPLEDLENPLENTLPKKLQDWYLLSYAEFLKELEKKKVKLSLSQKAEWEDYFTQEAAKVLALKNKIDTTDKAIDKMVYALYGLTDEEIAVVENS